VARLLRFPRWQSCGLKLLTIPSPRRSKSRTASARLGQKCCVTQGRQVVLLEVASQMAGEDREAALPEEARRLASLTVGEGRKAAVPEWASRLARGVVADGSQGRLQATSNSSRGPGREVVASRSSGRTLGREVVASSSKIAAAASKLAAAASDRSSSCS
jgi:hypothetical protein